MSLANVLVIDFEVDKFRDITHFVASIQRQSLDKRFLVKFRNYLLPAQIHDQRLISIGSPHCLTFRVRNVSEFWIEWIGTGTEECQQTLRDIGVRQRFRLNDLLGLAESIARSLGHTTIFLEDDARINDINMSLYTFFTTGKTFYERYGYEICSINGTIFLDTLHAIGNMTLHEALKKFPNHSGALLNDIQTSAILRSDLTHVASQENWTLSKIYITYFDLLNSTTSQTQRLKYLSSAEALNEFILEIVDRESGTNLSELEYCKNIVPSHEEYFT